MYMSHSICQNLTFILNRRIESPICETKQNSNCSRSHKSKVCEGDAPVPVPEKIEMHCSTIVLSLEPLLVLDDVSPI